MTKRGERPRYLHRPAPVEVQQPGSLSGAHCYCFALEGDRTAIDASADRYLNAAADDGLVYRAVLPIVLATFLDVERLSSTSEPYGWLRDREFALWTLMAAVQEHDEFPRIERLVAWMPYVWVDNAPAMMTGRGVWGFPKSIGQIDIPAQPDHAAVFSLDTLVWDKLGPDQEGRNENLVKFRRSDAGPLGKLDSEWSGPGHALEEFARLLTRHGSEAAVPTLGLIADLAEHLVHRDVPLVNLKQFRDCEDGAYAGYQSLVEGPCHVQTLYGGGILPGDWSTEFRAAESAPIAHDLGFANQCPTVHFAAWVHMDFLADNGHEVWRHGQGLIDPTRAN
jgi:hypothetical protein